MFQRKIFFHGKNTKKISCFTLSLFAPQIHFPYFLFLRPGLSTAPNADYLTGTIHMLTEGQGIREAVKLPHKGNVLLRRGGA